MRRTGPRSGWLSPALLLVIARPANADAHTVVTGTNHFMAGMLHPLTAPAHVLILLGLGLAIGQHLPLPLRLTLSVFAPFSALGLALTSTGGISGVHPAVLAGIALVVGGFVAVGKPLPPLATGTMLAAGALAMGLDSGVETGGAVAIIKTLLGTWVSLLILLLNVVHYVSLAAETDKKWLHIGIRVAGSWITAISVLMLAFALRK